MLTPEEASDVAAAAGLSPADAVALRISADTPEQATEIAAKFAPDTDRNMVRRLFAPPANPGTGLFAARPTIDPGDPAA